jgi:phage portal protein, SPP1 gp6-like|uniref:PORTAL PROTEIN n=1 Tax=Siphoviridae sp. ctedO8 TaxID=2827907 RepID=A0A8S5T2S7_9CAUD|nr:MAG TPA: PORTAL PROTEIN [Siphoviridae sp. ctedO8]
MLSDFANAMEEDSGRSILVLKGYGDEKPSAARAKIMEARIINVDSDGDLKTLTTTVEAANYQAILKESRDQLIKVARGYDAKDDRIGSNANRANIASMYNDIDLDANTLERHFKASLKQLLWFVDTYLLDVGKGSYFDIPTTIIFNRDTIVNTSEAIDGIVKAYQAGIITLKTAIKLYPDIDDVDGEIEQHEAEKNASLQQFGVYDEE